MPSFLANNGRKMLTPELEKLKNSLNCVSYNGVQHTDILIKENDKSASLKKVKLTYTTGNWFSFNPDKGSIKGKISTLLSNFEEYSPHRACDCVIVIDDNTKLKIIYIDLKSGNPIGYAGQFKSTRQFMRYAVGLINDFFDADLDISQEHFVIFFDQNSLPLRKRTTTLSSKKTKPDDACKIPILNNSDYKLDILLKMLES